MAATGLLVRRGNCRYTDGPHQPGAGPLRLPAPTRIEALCRHFHHSFHLRLTSGWRRRSPTPACSPRPSGRSWSKPTAKPSGPARAINRLLQGLSTSSVESMDEVSVAAAAAVRDPALEAPMTKLVDAMISDGVREGASDIHAEPLQDAVSVRYRIDGVLREVMRLPGSAGPALVRRIKILSRLDVTDPLHPHDGRAAVKVDGKQVDLRVATAPVARRGEKVVVRILDRRNLRANIPDLHLNPGEESLFR